MPHMPAEKETLISELRSQGHIVTEAVANAFLAVDRGDFAPGQASKIVYGGKSNVTRRNKAGKALSSLSAPWLQATMLEQAQLAARDSVLEIGSSGYNAALIAHLIGPTGKILTVDVSAEVVASAQENLQKSPNASRAQVEVLQFDAWDHTFDTNTPLDVIICTVDSWSIPPIAWNRLRIGGRLIIPMRLHGLPITIAFRRVRADKFESESLFWAGFVDAIGEGVTQLKYRHFATRGVQGYLVTEPREVVSEHELATLEREVARASAGVRLTVGESYDPICFRLFASSFTIGTLLADPEQERSRFPWLIPTGTPLLRDGPNFASLTADRLESGSYEVSVTGYGPDPQDLVNRTAKELSQWELDKRPGHPCISVHRQEAGGRIEPSGLQSRSFHRGTDDIRVSWNQKDA